MGVFPENALHRDGANHRSCQLDCNIGECGRATDALVSHPSLMLRHSLVLSLSSFIL